MLFKENCYLSISQEADAPFISLRLIQDKILFNVGYDTELVPSYIKFFPFFANC